MAHIKKALNTEKNWHTLSCFIQALQARDTLKIRQLLASNTCLTESSRQGTFLNLSRDGFCNKLNQTFLDLLDHTGYPALAGGTSIYPHPGAEVVEVWYYRMDEFQNGYSAPYVLFGRKKQKGDIGFRFGILLNDQGKISGLFKPHRAMDNAERYAMEVGN
jgi:hypothetical protein